VEDHSGREGNRMVLNLLSFVGIPAYSNAMTMPMLMHTFT
jgi:hypothetical protein